MSARKAGVNATQPRFSAARRRDAAPMAAFRDIPRSTSTWALTGQASACKPNQRTAVVRWLVATAGSARTDRGPFPEVKPRISQHVLEAAPSGRSTDASNPLDLFPHPGGPTMARIAPSFFYDTLKLVPLGGFCQPDDEKTKTVCKPLIPRRYTLCEVTEAKRQSVPPRESAFSRAQNGPVSGLSADRISRPLIEGRRVLSGSSVIPGLSAMGCTPYLLRLSNTCPFGDKLSFSDAFSRRVIPHQHWACAAFLPANPHSFVRTGGAA
ncbi:hypothetical protein Tbd_1350 [Thiobacillus denitrificans ATCC 25259]|uniref:Uncharacterized protein n=1 Tax=Thiobacillus denitrificans (strain ATCC 25259 / T1) TaxID=292415 RepID=Q3SJ64_THIDA|nr:hypothetical protein Tbd_1350 [Thiobacillus denitrificans ATCC 25259]